MAFLRPIVQALQGIGHAYADMTPASRERKQQEMGLAEYIANHPEAYDELAPLGKNLRIDLSKYAPSEGKRLEGVSAKIQKDPYTMTPNQIALEAKQSGVDTSPIGGQTARFAGSDTDEGLLPSTQYGPTNRPSIQTLMQQRQDQVAAQDANTQRKIATAGQLSDAQGFGETAGRARATHENAPTALSDLVTHRETIDPMDVAKAGNTEQAQFDSVNDIGRQRVAARGKGLISGAEASAQLPYQMYREQAKAQMDLANAKDLADYKNLNEPTASTRTMMEGARMVLPHFEQLRTMAKLLDQQGMFGPVMSRIRELGSRAGTVDEWESAINADAASQKDRLVGRFETELGFLASGAGRVHGGARGGGAISMINYMKTLIGANSTLPMFEGRMDSVEGYMKGYAAGPNGHVEQAPLPTNPVLQGGIDKLRRR
jgi:hypothetical protein